MNKLHMDAAPFIRHPDTTKSLMSDVLLTLLPLSVWSVYRNGMRAALLIGLCVFFSCVLDYFFTKHLRRPGTVRDRSAMVSGWILAAGLPAAVPLWFCPLGALIAVGLTKHLFGRGLGRNLLNPAATALLALHLLFPDAMTRFMAGKPHALAMQFDSVPAVETALDAVTQHQVPSLPLWDLVTGMDAGPLLYTPALLILLCGVFLVLRRTADPLPMLSCLGVSALLSFFSMPETLSLEFMTAYLSSGGLLFVCVFMLSDPTTTPATNTGRILFGVLAALLYYPLSHLLSATAALYACICLCNLLAPLLEYLTVPIPFGKGRKSIEPTAQRHRDYVMEFSALIREGKKKVEEVRKTHGEDEASLCARVLCGGSSRFCSTRHIYDGAHDCASATLVGGGSKSCFKACEGFGDCAKACKKGAIQIIDGIAVADPAKCDGCGDCLEVCPKRIITLVPAKARYWVGCVSPDDPVSTRKHCQAGCLGCHRCEKVCPTGAITVDGHTARIRYELCSSCGACAKECPRKCIWEMK